MYGTGRPVWLADLCALAALASYLLCPSHGRVSSSQPFIGVAFAVVMVPSARRAWNSLAVTVAGKEPW
jgi:hypothetical protein